MSAATLPTIKWETRLAPSRPYWLGTRRRRGPKDRVVLPKAGASRREAARSLVHGKQLETSVAKYLCETMTPTDERAKQIRHRHELTSALHKIWQAHAMAGDEKEAAKWEKRWIQVHNCESEWVGYRATCCEDRTRPYAVPVGCGHRMCPLCAGKRVARARARGKQMSGRLNHPGLITLTIPNVDWIHKGHFEHFRKRVRQFIAQHKEWILGGVYSLETTYNRSQGTWHIHVHILADLVSPLPDSTQKIPLVGRRICMFTAIKLKLEFDWMRLWVKSKEWGKKPKPGASKNRMDGEIYRFESWVKEGRANRLKEYRGGQWRHIEGLSAKEIAARTAWNQANRRVIYVQPVTDRDGAVNEVLKYITKGTEFCDLPDAVEAYSNAVQGARLIQTFGTWYGIDLDVQFDPAHLEKHTDDWSKMKCECGLNRFERMKGTFHRPDVGMEPSGQWRLKEPLDHKCRGTVPRPTIRALESEGTYELAERTALKSRTPEEEINWASIDFSEKETEGTWQTR